MVSPICIGQGPSPCLIFLQVSDSYQKVLHDQPNKKLFLD